MDGLLNSLPEIKAQYPSSPTPGTNSSIQSPSVEERSDDSDEEENAQSPLSSVSHDTGPNLLSRSDVVSLFPPLSAGHTEKLVAETVHALTAIGGHENPPARHIVGHEGVASVKEKLKTVSEELEDFVEVSTAVDFERPGVDQKRKHQLPGGDDGDDDADGPIDFGTTQ